MRPNKNEAKKNVQLTLNISLLPRPRLVKLSFGMYLAIYCNCQYIVPGNILFALVIFLKKKVAGTTMPPREESDDS